LACLCLDFSAYKICDPRPFISLSALPRFHLVPGRLEDAVWLKMQINEKLEKSNTTLLQGLPLREFKQKSGQQTPRRWGWGTPLKKRAATRMRQCYSPATICQLLNLILNKKKCFYWQIQPTLAGNDRKINKTSVRTDQKNAE
jgi:hypothetical protein